VKVWGGKRSGKKVDESKVKSLKALRTAAVGGASKKTLRPDTKWYHTDVPEVNFSLQIMQV
jgi:hypothetical protein